MSESEPRPLVFIDTETDGIHPGRKVWEVAMIRRELDGTERSYQAFVDIDLSTADPFGLRVGRFYERHPWGIHLAAGPTVQLRGLIASAARAKAITAYDAALTVAQWTHDCYVIGAVPWFDTDVLARTMREEMLIEAWRYHLIDVETLAAGALRLPPPWDFDALLAKAGLKYDEADRHTAMGDARMAMRLYDAVMDGALIP